MKIVGLTGGIGSGKSTIATMFAKLGVPIYIADTEAKKLTNTSKSIKNEIIELLGKESYKKNTINKEYVAKRIFNDKKLLQKINKIIHPKVAKHFKKWLAKQKGHYCIKEAAILFENGGYKYCDFNILVIAPEELRIQRILDRDTHITRSSIENRIKNQWDDSEKELLADIVIENIDLKKTQQKVKEIHLFLLKH